MARNIERWNVSEESDQFGTRISIKIKIRRLQQIDQ